MKEFINRPEDVVEEMLQGLVVLHPVRCACRDTKSWSAQMRGEFVTNRSPYSPAEEAAMSRHTQATSVRVC